MRLKFFKERKKRFKLKKKEVSRIIFRFLLKNEKVPFFKKLDISKRIASMPKASSVSQIHNYCAITGRSRSVLTPYGISRIKMRELMGYGVLPGFSRSAW